MPKIGTVPRPSEVIEDDFEELMLEGRPPMRPYQREGAAFLRKYGRAFLADDMGLGKSRQMIEASEGKTLVIAPAMLLDTNTWTNEINKWADDPERFTQVAYTSLNQRQKTDKGTSRLTKDVISDLGQTSWDTIICDEAHYIKSSKARRTNAVQQLARRTENLFLATGTPIPNWPHEIFVPLQLIYPEDAKPGGKYGSYWRWVDEWFKTEASRYSDFGFDVKGLRACNAGCVNKDPLRPCKHHVEFAAANFGGRFLQRLRDDVLTDLPPLTFDPIRIPMTVEQEREYKRMKRDFIAEVGDDEVIAWSDAAKNTLRASNKFEMLREDLSERFSPTLVVAHYRVSVEACAEVARSLGKTARVLHGGTPKADRKTAAEDFQAGKIDVLAGSLDTIAEGLTLTAADMVILVESSYKPHRNAQVMRRIHRMGQTRPCFVKDYISTTRRGGNTLDTKKRDLLKAKTDFQTRILTAAQFKRLLED
jgi:SWI/SNF-related matrix-associated actin-dependent regulator 1 of chromatin subfamily A